ADVQLAAEEGRGVLPCSLCSGLGGVPHRQWSRRAPATAPRTRRACTGRRAPATGSSQSGAAQFQSEVYIPSASLLHFHAEFAGESRCAFRYVASDTDAPGLRSHLTGRRRLAPRVNTRDW